MVLKVSISLPGDTLITFEASDPQFFRDVIGLALKELPKELIHMQMGRTSPKGSEDGGKNVTPRSSSAAQAGRHEDVPNDPEPSPQANRNTETEESFTRFCSSLSHLGDMRRVVVAAEGARRFLGMEEVSDRDLGELFDLVGWRQPGDFVQTLRNAARSKFHWLERVPGRPGCYAVTETGRETVIRPTVR